MWTSNIRFRQTWWMDGLSQDEMGDYHFDGEMDVETFSAAAVSIGRNNAPALMRDLVYFDNSLDLEAHPGIIAHAWSWAEYPESSLRADHWVDLFQMAGYTHDGRPAKLPRRPITIYRGCTPDRCEGMAWTSDLRVARRFARDERDGRPTGHVYAVDAPPRALLAHIHEDSEYVIDLYSFEDAVRLIEE
jgi:hypothetical protein